MISTEASALMRLAGEAGKRSKIVLTGEGADEAFAGYLAFRQYRQLGALTGRGLSPLRTMVRPWLRGHYGSECLLPGRTGWACWPSISAACRRRPMSGSSTARR